MKKTIGELFRANGYWQVAEGNSEGVKALGELPDMTFLFKKDGTPDMRYGVNKLKKLFDEASGNESDFEQHLLERKK